MRIAIFTEYYFPFISGVVTHIKTLKDQLERQGHQVLIVTGDPKAKKHRLENGILYCPAKGIKRIYGYGVTLPLSWKRLDYLKEFNPDIIHIHTEFTVGVFGLWVARKLKKPIVYTLHTMYDDYTFYLFPERFEKYAKIIAHTYFRNVAKRATEIIGPSRKVAEFLHRCNVDRHINIIPNVIDLTIFERDNVNMEKVREIKKKYGISDDNITLCFVGRLGKEKSVDELLKAFSYASESDERFRLIIIGEGPEADSLRELTKNLRVQDKVFFRGKILHKDIPQYYYASDLYATASLTEMNSISTLEAMGSGLMVLQRYDVYNKDQIKEGTSGWFFKNKEEFSKLLTAYASLSINERNDMRQKAAEYSRNYGPDEFIEKVINVYELALHKYHSEK